VTARYTDIWADFILVCLILVCLFFGTSCTVIHGNASEGTYTYASLGGDASDYAQTATGVTASKLDNSTSFREGNSTLRQAVWAGALKSVASTASKAWSGVKKSEQVTARAVDANANATRQAAIAAKTEQARIAAEAAAAVE
jgi:hypothetical protein